MHARFDLTSSVCKNIVMFHRITGASVVVVVRDERATRTLRKGLDHGKFVELLEKAFPLSGSRMSPK